MGGATLTSREDMRAAGGDRPAARSSKAGGVDCARVRCVALTYEDGPGPETGRLLDVLGAHGARAAFFALGSNASARPELLDRITPGAIVLMHDVHGATVDAAPEILREIASRGYTFVTVPELYGSHAMEPGRTTTPGPCRTC